MKLQPHNILLFSVFLCSIRADNDFSSDISLSNSTSNNYSDYDKALIEDYNSLIDDELDHEENYNPAEYIQINDEIQVDKSSEITNFLDFLDEFKPTDILIPTFYNHQVKLYLIFKELWDFF